MANRQRKIKKFQKLLGVDYFANIKAFAIFFLVLLITDLVLFITTGSYAGRNYLYLIINNMSIAGILQFLYIRFDKKGLYVIEGYFFLIIALTVIEVIYYTTYGLFLPILTTVDTAKSAGTSVSTVKMIANNVTFIIRFYIFYGVVLVTINEYLIKKKNIKPFYELTKKIKQINIIILVASFLIFIISFAVINKSNDFTINVKKYGIKTAILKRSYKTNESFSLLKGGSELANENEIDNENHDIGNENKIILKNKTNESFVEYFKECNAKHLKRKAKGEIPIKKKKKTVYLTFDDGPNNYNDQILDILDRNNIKATFFIVGNGRREAVKKIKNAGHTVGLHSASHNYAYIYEDVNSYLRDLYDLQSYAYTVTGAYSNIIRFPGGSRNSISNNINYGIMDTLRPLVEELGFEYIDWHVATGDSSSDTNKEHVLESVRRGIFSNYDELVILMHDLHPVTVEALDEVLELCREAGYEFDRITEDTVPLHVMGSK